MRVLILLQLLLLGASIDAAALIFVSVAPQLEAVRRIGGERVEAEVLVPPGASPEYYQPDARRLLALSRARALLCIGAPLEKALLPKLRKSFPDLALVDLREGMSLRRLTAAEAPQGAHAHDHEHERQRAGHAHAHHAGEADPHVWLSVNNMICHAENVIRALSALDPAGSAAYQERGRLYCEELRALEARLARQLAPLRGMTVMVFHPAFGYFLDAYGLEQLTVEQGGKEPSARQLAALLRVAKTKDLRAIYIQPQFNERTARNIAKTLGLQLRVWDPLPDPFIAGMDQMAAMLLEVQGGN